MAKEDHVHGRWHTELREQAQARGLSGRAMVEAMAAGDLPAPPLTQLLGLRLTEAGGGRAVMRVTPDERHANGGGFAHGGLAATMIDSATGCAVWSMIDDGTRIATVELNVTYLRPVGPRGGDLVAEATVVHTGDSIGVATAEIRDASGALVATGRATYAIRR